MKTFLFSCIGSWAESVISYSFAEAKDIVFQALLNIWAPWQLLFVIQKCVFD